jgi:hypothetical protein
MIRTRWTTRLSRSVGTGSAARTTRAVGLVALLVAAVGCGSGSSTGPRGNSNGGNQGGVMGNYDLVQIDQASLPQEVYHGPYFDPNTHHFYNQLVVKVTGAIMELDELGNFYLTVDYSGTADGAPFTTAGELDGTYKTYSNNSVDFQPDGATNSYVSGSVRNGVLTLPLDLWKRGRLQSYSFRVLK